MISMKVRRRVGREHPVRDREDRAGRRAHLPRLDAAWLWPLGRGCELTLTLALLLALALAVALTR